MGGLLNLPVGTVLAQLLGWRLWIALQRELCCFGPLILVESLGVLRHGLLDASELFLNRTILGKGREGSKNRQRTHHEQPLAMQIARSMADRLEKVFVEFRLIRVSLFYVILEPSEYERCFPYGVGTTL